MKNLRFPFLLLAFVVVFNACKKKDDPAPPTKTELLTAKTWKITTYTVNPKLEIKDTVNNTSIFIDNIIDYYNKNGAACLTDDIIKFSKTSTSYTREEGAIVCSGRSQVYETGTWTFNSTETVLVLSVPGYSPDNYTIQTLDATTLVLVSTATSSSGTTYTFTETYTAQ